ncbi:gluconokinase [Bacillus sp. B-jedd]|uniref:gluconokinase n=1 Tax=Bacillus sp. B-jedd TaxID=1476857 RepID=UPI00051564DF|nr:gluconokinase [Bacillus sp. B-jedd]CEG29068.1 gluconokinase [Bacillus sp. B-jedd]
MYVIGLDIGTTSTKASIFAKTGRFIASAAVGYPIIHPQPDWAEQDPDAIYSAVLESVRSAIISAKIDAGELLGIGISSAMHSIMAVDENGKPLTNSIIWADNRSWKYAEELKAQPLGTEIYLKTGTPIHPMSPLSKLLWMKNEQPELFSKTHKWISIKEYITWKWFGEYFVDYSIASATGLFNLRYLDWDEQVLELLGLHRDKFSKPVPTTAINRNMDGDAATAMGIPADLPVVAGASDGVLANLGAGAISEGEYSVTIGTSGAIRTVVSGPTLDPLGRTFCYYLADRKWVIGGPVNNGGIALRWFKDQFCLQEDSSAAEPTFDLMIEEASRVPAGAGGLLFLPYLSGERAPLWNANTRGAFFGISLTHRREHFIRAVLEGVIYAVYSVGVILEEIAGPGKELHVSGGFARSEVWRQILADIFGKTVEVPESHESSGFGAAVMALHALGHIGSLEEVKQMINIQLRQTPFQENKEIYRTMHNVYQNLTRDMLGHFNTLSEIQRKGFKWIRA